MVEGDDGRGEGEKVKQKGKEEKRRKKRNSGEEERRGGRDGVV